MMRSLVLAAAVTGSLALAACEPAADVPAAEPVAAKPKSLARSAPMYAGQEAIHSVETGAVEIDDGVLILKVKGATASPGYTDAAFLPRVYAAAPKDGVYEVDVIATTPPAGAAQAITPIEVERAWANYPKDRLKGVKFMSKTNDVVAMLPAPSGS
jgi:hypothetical protein